MPPVAQTSYKRTCNVLSVSPIEADHLALCAILRESRSNIETHCKWTVYAACSVESTAEVLSAQEIPVIVSEGKLHPGTWQELLQYISLLPDPPLLIVASRLADERLWAEALNLGAWDVLAKPFDTEEVIRVVASAWRHWQDRRNVPVAKGPRQLEDRLFTLE